MLSKPKAAVSAGKRVGGMDIDAQQVANGVVVLGAIEAAGGDAAGLGFDETVLARELGLQPARRRGYRFAGRRRQGRGRHLFRLQLLEDLLPEFTIVNEGVLGGGGRLEIEVAGFQFRVVTRNAVLLNQGQKFVGVGSQKQGSGKQGQGDCAKHVQKNGSRGFQYTSLRRHRGVRIRLRCAFV